MKKLFLLFVISLHCLSLCAQNKNQLGYLCKILLVENDVLYEPRNDMFDLSMGVMPNSLNEISVYNTCDPIDTYKIKLTIDLASLEKIEGDYSYNGTIHYPVDKQGAVDFEYICRMDKISGKGIWKQESCRVITSPEAIETFKSLDRWFVLAQTPTRHLLITVTYSEEIIKYRKEWVEYLKNN